MLRSAKCCANSQVFEELGIASRTLSKCDALKAELEGTTGKRCTTAQVDAGNVEELTALIEREKPQVVLKLALPYQDLGRSWRCAGHRTPYVDTANYEPEDTAKFEYKWQWAYREKFEKGRHHNTAGQVIRPGCHGSILGVYAADTILTVSTILIFWTCNGGDHGYPFATNFNPEINIREVSAKGSYWEDGHGWRQNLWKMKRVNNFAEVGKRICICSTMRNWNLLR